MGNDVLALVLAGGEGSRLRPLTDDRAKPAVPFGGRYRLVDFVLSNLVNSGFFRIKVLTQYKSDSLNNHLSRSWRMTAFLGHFIEAVPAQMRTGLDWYKGSADAIYQNLHLVDNNRADLVAIFSGDHIYKMDIAHMVEYHLENQADVTIAAYPTPVEDGNRFGVLQVETDWRISEFQEKPDDPKPIPGRETHCLASMGNYIFSVGTLVELLSEDAMLQASDHDFGKDVLPRALTAGKRLYAYDFARNPIPGQQGPNTYWRDVGTLDSYWAANMDLVGVEPEFDLYNEEWPLRTSAEYSPPAKFVHEETERRGQAYNSLLAGGVIVSGATVRESVLFRRVRVNSYALVERSVIFDNVEIGRHCVVRNAIIDKNVRVPAGTQIGVDLAEDRARGFTVLPSGLVTVPKGYAFD